MAGDWFQFFHCDHINGLIFEKQSGGLNKNMFASFHLIVYLCISEVFGCKFCEIQLVIGIA